MVRTVQPGPIVPKPEEVLRTATELETASLPEPLPPPVSTEDIDWTTFKLIRQNKVQVNAFVDEAVYARAQAVGIATFVEAAIKYAVPNWQTILREIMPYEDRRKASRKAGRLSYTISGRIEPQLHAMLTRIGEQCRAIPGFKLSRFVAAALAVHARNSQ
jgi:hypothetical protein